MKNGFYFILKSLFSHVEKRLEQKGKVNWLISKFMMSQPRKQTIAIYRLPDTSRSKGNQTMKFGQLMT